MKKALAPPVERHASHAARHQTKEFSTRLETKAGPLDLHLARHRLDTETIVVMEGWIGAHHFRRRFTRRDDEIQIRFEDQERGTSLYWFQDAEQDHVDLLVRHDGQAPHLARIDTSEPRSEGPLVDTSGQVVDLQGKREPLPLHCDEVLEFLATDPAFIDFLYGSAVLLEGGVLVSGRVRMLSNLAPVPFAKVTLRSCPSFAEATKGLCLSKNERVMLADAQGHFAFEHVHGAYIQIIAESLFDPKHPKEGFFEQDGVMGDLKRDVLIGPAQKPFHDIFAACDIIFDGDIGGLVDCYVWVIIYG